MRATATVKNVRITELLITEGLERKPGEDAGPGDIVAIAGIPDITIGETLADPENPVALPLIHVDEPAISMTIGTNTSPLVGRVKGPRSPPAWSRTASTASWSATSRCGSSPTERPDAWEVQGRGELALAILVEQMRREGYELTVGKPQVVTKEVDGKVHEPFERLTIDAPEEYLGAITELLAARKGRMEQMTNHGTGWVRMEFLVPARGLIGFRTEFLTDTRGTGIAHHISEGYEPWAGEIRTRNNGSLVADRSGAATAYAMTNLQERGIMFVEPTTEVYEGMIVGENSRADDMDVNITKEKQQTNIRSATSDNFEKLIPPRKLSLEQCLEFCREDECVEVTPRSVRIRKVVLDQNERAKTASRARKAPSRSCCARLRAAAWSTTDARWATTDASVRPRVCGWTAARARCRSHRGERRPVLHTVVTRHRVGPRPLPPGRASTGGRRPPGVHPGLVVLRLTAVIAIPANPAASSRIVALDSGPGAATTPAGSARAAAAPSGPSAAWSGRGTARARAAAPRGRTPRSSRRGRPRGRPPWSPRRAPPLWITPTFTERRKNTISIA